VPDGIAALGPDAVATVQTLVQDAERAQARELRASLDRTLSIVPRPLRGVVKKLAGA
jgi:hypothetical protein